MCDADNIREVSALGIDLMGFIFVPKSPRYVQMISSKAGIIPDYSEERIRRMRGEQGVAGTSAVAGAKQETAEKPARVGVFVDDMPQNIVTRVYNYDLDYIQLHGSEPRETCENLRSTIDPDIKKGIKIIKAINVATADDIGKYKEYVGAVDLFLFDTKTHLAGGSGQQFDWQVLDAYDGETPFLLSGGIGLEDAERIKAYRHPKCIGIDLNSKFEIEPGLKDVEKLRKFILKVKK